MARKIDINVHEEDEDMEEQPEASTSAIGFTDLPCLSDGNFSTSYTWHSVGEEGRYSASAGELDEEEEERWILGIDEAGRGPVLGESMYRAYLRADWKPWLIPLHTRLCSGPQVYGCAYCPAKFSDGLKELGFAGQCGLA